MDTMNSVGDARAQLTAPGWYPTGVTYVMRWWNGQAWTDHLMVAGRPTTVSEYRSRARVMAIASVAIAVVFVLAIVTLAIVSRSSAVLGSVWFGCIILPGAAIVVVLMTSGMRRRIQETGIV